MGDRPTIVAELRETLQKVVQQPELVEQKAAAARQRVLSSFTWDVKAEQIIQVYEWVLQQRPERPSWGMPFRDPVWPVAINEVRIVLRRTSQVEGSPRSPRRVECPRVTGGGADPVVSPVQRLRNVCE